MTKEEAIAVLRREIEPSVYEDEKSIAEALNMAIEALQTEGAQGVGRYENAMQKLQEMPKYINSNTIGKKLEVLNHTKENKNGENK